MYMNVAYENMSPTIKIKLKSIFPRFVKFSDSLEDII